MGVWNVVRDNIKRCGNGRLLYPELSSPLGISPLMLPLGFNNCIEVSTLAMPSKSSPSTIVLSPLIQP